MKRIILAALLLLLFGFEKAQSQDTLRALFLGNSYTNYNSLPQMVANMAASANKVLVVDYNMPGGYTLENHSTDANSLSKIRRGNWDYVIIQEQSQLPSIDYYRYNAMFPAAQKLRDSINYYNSCATIITYMTWGRRFGGRQCDPSSTYCSPDFVNFNHMQDTLTKAYIQTSNLINAQCAPVGAAWQNILNDTNFVLHISDNSHPTLMGSYIAACVIHSSIWKQNTLGLSYTAGLATSTARYIQAKADSTVFLNDQTWNLNINIPQVVFMNVASDLTVQFFNQSRAGREMTFTWDFGDSTTSTETNPEHIFPRNGYYQVKLIARTCNGVDSLTRSIYVGEITHTNKTINQTEIHLYPNPANTILHIQNQTGLPLKGKIYNNLGQIVGVVDEMNLEAEINLVHLSKGIYVLTLENESKVFRQKFIKE